MLPVQKMYTIAHRYKTSMSAAMIGACITWSLKTKTPLVKPITRPKARRRIEVRPAEEEVDWKELTEGNRDSRWIHQ